MAGQGSLTFFLDEKPRSPEDGRAGEQVRFARLRVSDTGCGMDKTVLDRAFEPFFTTKPIGEGTGLGLSVVYGLIHEIGGTIALDSQPGRGTTVTILLPGRRRETDNGIDIGN
jgi:signal transduction histidine kinase